MKSLKFEKFLTLRNSQGISKKAQGLSINAIIVAAIALIVLVVLVAIFTGRLGTWGKGVTEASKNDCKLALGGTCYSADQGCPEKTVRAYGATCAEATPICCIAKGTAE